MKEHMKMILRQQQEYEYLKNAPSIRWFPNMPFRSTKLTTIVLPYMKKLKKRKKWQRLPILTAKIFFYCLILYFIYCLAALILIDLIDITYFLI